MSRSNERRELLPVGWELHRIGDIGRTQTGGTPRRNREDFFGGDIPWVKSGELGDGLVTAAGETITQAGLDQSNAKLFPAGTLCLALYGATVGKLGILQIAAATNQAVCGIFLPDSIDAKFVFHFLYHIRQELIKQGKGGAQSNISNAIVRDTQIPVPPLDVQRRVVAKIEELLSDLDAGVAALERVRANLKRYRAAVLKAAVEGRLTEQWRAEHPDAEPASELLQRILTERRRQWEQDQLAKYEAKGKKPPKGWKDKYKEPAEPDVANLPLLPARWCWSTIDQLSSSQRNGLSKKPSPSPPGHAILRINAVRPMAVRLDEIRFYNHPKDAVEDYFISDGDLLFTRYNGSVDLLGVAGMVRGCQRPTLHPDKLIRVQTVLRSPLPDYIETASNTGSSRSHIVSRARTTAGQNGISGTDVRDMPVPICPLDEQAEIVRLVQEHLCQEALASKEVEKNIHRTTRLRQGILKRAFEGNLVPEVSTAATTEGVAIAANEAPTPRLPLRSRQLAFAAKAVDRLAERIEFGQTQLVKFLYLVQYGLGVSLGITPQQYPRGPFFKAIYEIEKDAAENDIFRHWSRPRRGTLYRKGDKIAEWLTAADDLLGDRKNAMEQLLDHFAHMDTDAAELTVTVYAVWNDLLLDGKTWDAEIITQGVHDWHESKQRFTLKEVKARMRWLEANGLKPTGQGLRTEPAEPAGLFEGA